MTSHMTLLHTPLTRNPQPPVALERTIVFTDVVDSTVLVDQLGDRCLLEVVVAHHELAVELGETLGADHVASTGDGAYAVFADATSAMAFARGMIVGMRRASSSGACPAVRLHVGVASGVVHRWNGDYFGRTMHMAARICRSARPNEILVNATCARALPANQAWLGPRRQVELRGFCDAETIHQFCLDPADIDEFTRQAAMA